jgi:ribosomal-protein-alanine N-acetyltransferase
MPLSIETARLLLRPFQESDAEYAHAWFSDPEVMRFFGYGPFVSVGETVEKIRQYRAHHEKHGFGKWVVLERVTGGAIGDAGLTRRNETGEIQLGYKFASLYWGRGFATEAAQACIKFGFAQLALPRITAFVHPDNVASIRVLKKAGFSYFGRDRIKDREDVYEMYPPPSDL